MINKKTAILFILLANIALLTHAVVPHHHHENLSEFCMQGIHANTVHTDSKHIHPYCNHESNGHESTDCCILKQAFTIISGSVRQEKVPDENEGGHIPFPSLITIMPVNGVICLGKYRIVHPLPLIILFYSSFTSSTSGLRAPPPAV